MDPDVERITTAWNSLQSSLSDINNMTMSNLLSQLSFFSSWVYSPYAFTMSILAKGEFEKNAYFYYEDPCFRYFRAQRFMNLQSVEMKWINDLCHRYSNGDPNNLIVVAGDWCKDRSATLKRGSSPASYQRILTRMRNMGLTVLLVDESYTSKRCHVCRENEIQQGAEKVQVQCTGDNIPAMRINPKFGRYNELKTHGRVMCNACCGKQKYIIHNRDINASRNIYRLAVQLLTRGGRPKDIPQYVPKNRR